jgi:hypothetical protein
MAVIAQITAYISTLLYAVISNPRIVKTMQNQHDIQIDRCKIAVLTAWALRKRPSRLPFPLTNSTAFQHYTFSGFSRSRGSLLPVIPAAHLSRNPFHKPARAVFSPPGPRGSFRVRSALRLCLRPEYSVLLGRPVVTGLLPATASLRAVRPSVYACAWICADSVCSCPGKRRLYAQTPGSAGVHAHARGSVHVRLYPGERKGHR